jgi:hypothetical protein
MGPKRLVSDRPDEDTMEHGLGVKRQKTARHWRKMGAVVQDFLDMLSPAAPGSLADFNKWENEERRRGVHPIDIVLLQLRVKQLQAVTDVETLDTKLNEIDSFLAAAQVRYRNYINALAKDKAAQEVVEAVLGDVIQRIEEARGQLPGMVPYWMSCGRKAKRYYP